MTHELKHIFRAYEKRANENSVLATVVALDGSSYRRPGVSMLLFEDGIMVGAVSGGCVEKEVLRQAQKVFATGVSRIMIYDGRYRLGCEGVLYILLEKFSPSPELKKAFWEALDKRFPFEMHSHFQKEQVDNPKFGSFLKFGKQEYPLAGTIKNSREKFELFSQQMEPCFQLMIIGAEHDAVQLCKFAALTGWEVTVVAHIQEEKSIQDFPGIHKLLQVDPEQFLPEVDDQTAVVVMTHSYVKDLQYLSALKDSKVPYIGLLGPSKRREKLFDELLERFPELSEEFLDKVHGPAGLDIGAETPQEIAISIVSEILTIRNKKEPIWLKDKIGKIHT